MAKQQINLYVDAGRKDRWTSAVDSEPDYESLSHLVRVSVERELNRLYDGAKTTVRPDSSEKSGEILGAINRLERTVEDISERFDRIEREAKSEGPEYDLKKVVHAVLPTEDELQDGESGVSPTEIARQIGTDDVNVVTDILHELAATTGQVQRIEEVAQDVNSGPETHAVYRKRE